MTSFVQIQQEVYTNCPLLLDEIMKDLVAEVLGPVSE